MPELGIADGGVEAHGKLTIRDRTAPVVLKVKFAEAGDKATLDVDTVLKRADYSLGAGSDWSDVGADVPVHFRGVAIAMVTAGLMALAFMGFAGLDKYQ